MSDDWVPDTCSLPTTERPLRVAEFDRLFAERLTGQSRLSATLLRLHLAGGPGVVARVRDLAARETGCCSFFDFEVSEADGAVVVEIGVPAAQVSVLDALAARAQALAA